MNTKPEVFLEIGAGFLRIPTADINYTITVIDVGGAHAPVASEPVLPPPDDFYELVANDLYRGLGAFAGAFSPVIVGVLGGDIDVGQISQGAEVDGGACEDLAKLCGRVAAENLKVQDALVELRTPPALDSPAGDEADPAGGGEDTLAGLVAQFDEVLGLIQGLDVAAPQEEAPVVEKKSRYLFDLDVIFQTLYELCTNETVKDHITETRGKAAELFDITGFHDKISEKAVQYQADSDHYFDVPMSDVFQSLFGVCSDKGVKNLLKKMDSGQGSIFLDQAIPLEVPKIEEVEVESKVEAPPAGAEVDTSAIVSLLGEMRQVVEAVVPAAPSPQGAEENGAVDGEGMVQKIEDALAASSVMAADISTLAALVTASVSSDKQSGTLPPVAELPWQLLDLIVRFGTLLKNKTENHSLSMVNGKEVAEAEVERLLGTGSQDGERSLMDQERVKAILAEYDFG